MIINGNIDCVINTDLSSESEAYILIKNSGVINTNIPVSINIETNCSITAKLKYYLRMCFSCVIAHGIVRGKNCVLTVSQYDKHKLDNPSHIMLSVPMVE